jgi:ankyrin repeat protein
MDDINHELKLAIDNKNINRILELVTQGADPNVKSYILKYTAFETICFSKCDFETISFLISKGANIHGSLANKIYSGIYIGCLDLNKDMVKFFFNLGVDVNSDYTFSRIIVVPCLFINSENKNTVISITKYLIKNGADIYDENGELFTDLKKEPIENWFDIEDYYNKYSPYTGSIKPAKR